MSIVNTGSAPDRLIGGSVAGAGKFEVHEMSMDGGVMKMRPLPKGLEIKPGQTVELKPGSYHVMFVGLKQPFEQGKSVKGTLEFEKAGKVDGRIRRGSHRRVAAGAAQRRPSRALEPQLRYA